MKRLLCLVVCFLLIFNVARVAMQLQRDPTLTSEEYEYLSIESVLRIASKYEYSVGESLNRFVDLYDAYFSEYHAYQEYMENTTWYERFLNNFWERTSLSEELVFNLETGEVEKVKVDYPDPVKYSLSFYDALFVFLTSVIGDALTFLNMSCEMLSTFLGFREYAPTA